MVHERRNLDELLGRALPGLEWLGEGRGRCRVSGSVVGWELEAEGEGFWLVLRGACGAGKARSRPAEWPWPIRPARRVAGGEDGWIGDAWLVGSPDDPREVLGLVQTVGEWSGGHCGPLGQRGADDAPLADDELRLLPEAFGAAPRRSGGRFRLPAADGPAIELVAECGQWRIACTLARPVRETGPEAVGAIADLLAVANDRLRGVRAVIADDGTALLETFLRREGACPAALRAAVDRLSSPSRPLSRACRVLCDAPGLAAAYARRWLGGPSLGRQPLGSAIEMIPV
jgi:hypothetical protein